MSPTSRPDGTQSVLLTSFCHERAAAPFLESLASAGVRAWTEGGEKEAWVLKNGHLGFHDFLG